MYSVLYQEDEIGILIIKCIYIFRMFKTRSPGNEQSIQATKSWKLELVDKRGYMKTLDRST